MPPSWCLRTGIGGSFAVLPLAGGAGEAHMSKASMHHCQHARFAAQHPSRTGLDGRLSLRSKIATYITQLCTEKVSTSF